MNYSIDHTRRHLNFPNLLNARDLGYLPTASGQQTRWGAFVRSDYLGLLDDTGRQALLAHGVRTIIDLRFAYELAMSPYYFQLNPAGEIGYTNISLHGEVGDPHYEPLRQLANSPAAWVEPQLELGRWQIGRIIRAIAHAPEGGVLFHCYAGTDRTGMIAQLLLSLVDVPQEIIAQDYLLSIDRMTARYLELNAKIEDPIKRERERIEWLTRPQNALTMLNFVKQHYGSTEAYLQYAGLNNADIERLRQRLLD